MARGSGSSRSRDDYSSLNDHDLIIEMNVKQDLMGKQFSNHLKHHWAITITALGAALSGLLGFASSMIILLLRFGIFNK